MTSERHNLADLTTLEHPSVVMMVGVPGSGKSYLAEQLSGLLNIPVLSPDECRREISGDANDQSVSREAWDMVYDRADQAMEKGQSVIIDGTHANAEMRRRDIQRYRQFGACTVVGIYVQTPIDTSIMRNNSRERVVPEYVIHNMQRGIDRTPPSVDDGFDFVIPVST